LSRDDFYTPTDMDALRMENELLTFEVRFLKAQLGDERSAAQLKNRLEESERSAAQLRDRAERAERDLALLLRRLANSPLGWLFRLSQNFRTLEQRYLGTNA
jgi:hypothetical protein